LENNNDWSDMEYIFHIIIMINIYSILTVCTNLVVGSANLLTLGQAAFYGIGAYITALGLMILGLSLIPSLLLAILITGIISFIIGYISLRLEGDYFILATLGFQMIAYTILYNWISVTKGPFGIPGIPSPKLFGILEISGIKGFLILSSILLILVIVVFYRLLYSPYGRALRAMRDDPIALISLGRDITKLKISAFTISSSFVAVSGFLYATYISYIDPTSFNLDEAIFILSALLIGGTGNIKGPVIGAIFIVVLPELLRFVGFSDTIAANLRMIIYGLALFIFMYFRPQGILGNYKFER